MTKSKYVTFGAKRFSHLRFSTAILLNLSSQVDLRDYVELKKTVTKDNIRKLSKKFANQVDSVLKSTLVEFDEEEEDWSPEFIDQVKAELAKYKEVCAETRVNI